ncbi:MAG: RNA 2',3'-cyclic phosphodiesterase [Verrucomicrobia bacterium]|nr:RNA 2',3'-cyclic phosphodiesterase [Verrucomicrobiota bacterium]
MRLFIAVDISEAVRDAVAATQSQLKLANADVAWVKPENFHLTLKFLGEVPDEELDDINAALDLAAAPHGAFEMEMRGMGCFPDRGVPRVVWAGVGEGRDALKGLARDLEEAMAALRFAREKREFAAHLTIGRVRSPRGADRLRRHVDAELETVFGRSTVDQVRLYKSTLAPGGSIYEVLGAAKLSDAPGRAV